ncbi:hypothetical protein [Aeromonas sp. L_1B5_3]|uniref:hypothetical protein n=1 Tax=Aeromonas sp. L_1B5_3 TaxID=1588629 RepID=UPI0012E0862A|nr:hypothetical protein [Aeromonas sp. L_1B5_3]
MRLFVDKTNIMEVADYKGMLLFGIRKWCCLLRHFLADGVTGVTDSSNSTDMSPFFTCLPLQSVEVAVDKPDAFWVPRRGHHTLVDRLLCSGFTHVGAALVSSWLLYGDWRPEVGSSVSSNG